MSGDFGEYWKKLAPLKSFRMMAFTGEERNNAIRRCQDLIGAQRGDVLDFREFSDLSVNLAVEMKGPGLLALVDSLLALGWYVDLLPSREEVLQSAGDRMLAGTVQVTFAQGDGSRKTTIPAVPG